MTIGNGHKLAKEMAMYISEEVERICGERLDVLEKRIQGLEEYAFPDDPPIEFDHLNMID